MKKPLILLLCVLLLSVGMVYFALPYLNSYQQDGEISFTELEQPVTVHRDKHGVPYVFAKSIADAIRAQGFVIAQDRVFQIEMYRAIISGKLASIVGESGVDSDIKMLVLGIHKNAERHFEFLNNENKNYLRWYAQGYNSFIANRSKEFPLELGLLGITPEAISVVDLLAVQHFAGFIQARNYEDEILSLNLDNALGTELANTLRPLNINPDRNTPVLPPRREVNKSMEAVSSNTLIVNSGLTQPVALPASGSNNWVTGNSKSSNGMPILVNDPHLDATILPGPWYPIGLFTPNISAIGANLPGVPGLLLGRTQHVSFGLTNAYGDSQDLYIELIDPDNPQNYMDGDISRPLVIERKTIKIKDQSTANGIRETTIAIRHTRRGPIISDHKIFGIQSSKPIVFRSAAAEITSDSLGFIDALTAKTVADVDLAFSKIDVLYINYVFADKFGGIGHRPTGAIPLRDNGETAKLAAAVDDWKGFIPKADMPGQMNPSKDWLGTSNHDVIPDDYPYYYSNHFSPNYRYLRTKELLNEAQDISAVQHWNMLKDVKNKHAEKLMPTLLALLENEASLTDLHRELSNWDYEDRIDSVAATIFHLTHEYLIRLTFEDEIPEPLLKNLLKSRYYWLQRTDDLILSGESEWFDIKGTDKLETLQDLVIMAANMAKSNLVSQLGDDRSEWRWGNYHTVSFVSPLRLEGLGSDIFGGGTHEVSGSGETLNRGQYSLNKGPYKSQWFSSLRMVADMSDDQKIMASMSGGNASRQFHPYFKSQLESWLNQEWVPWWLDKSSVEQNSKHKLQLVPGK
ncbi:MAG: penicillin acylase family protein [Arenicella sp.]|nr:penicillin acylase family protein [Arenicella sp.]